MRFEVERRFLLGFLVLTTLFLAWSLFVTGGKMKKVVHAKDTEELFGTVTMKQKKGRPLPLSKLEYQPGSPKFYASRACPPPSSPPPPSPPQPVPPPASPPPPLGNPGPVPL